MRIQLVDDRRARLLQEEEGALFWKWQHVFSNFNQWLVPNTIRAALLENERIREIYISSRGWKGSTGLVRWMPDFLSKQLTSWRARDRNVGLSAIARICIRHATCPCWCKTNHIPHLSIISQAHRWQENAESKFARPAETRSFTNVLLLKSTEDPQISSENYQTRNLNTAYVSSTDEDAVAFRDLFGAAVTMRTNDKFWSNIYMSAFSCHPRGKENNIITAVRHDCLQNSKNSEWLMHTSLAEGCKY